jgi:putative CocE/NonD family hydrolase
VSATLIEWFMSKLGGPAEGEESPRVRLFVQGVDRWRAEEDWPPMAATATRWYLRSGGRLSPEPPGMDEGFDAFVFDPRDPCPTRGGDLVKPPRYVPGPVDQGPILGRRDVLVYTSEPLQREVTVIGPVTALVHGATSGIGTDWVVKLCDVDERGRTTNVCDGIVRTDPGRAGTRVASEVDMWGTAIVFRAGHRIRVIVTSSDFPRYERNPNTGHDPWETAVLEPALQRVFHEGPSASHIVLPVIS